MKGLVLHQPWATLMAVGAKLVETRGWRPKVLDVDVAIIAGLKAPPRSDCDNGPAQLSPQFVEEAIQALGVADFERLPRGQVLMVARLIEVRPTEEQGRMNGMSAREILFGDYRPGRWAWLFAHRRVLREPVHVTGQRGLFTLTPQDAAAVRAMLP